MFQSSEHMNQQKSSDSLISYLAAIAPALLQLIAVLSVGLVNVLKFNEFVLAPGFINIANFLVILLAISLISLASFWDYNKFSLIKSGGNLFDQTKNFWFGLKIFFSLAVVGFFIFIAIVINRSNITSNIELWTLLQWTTYIASMISVSFIIYAFALLKIQEKQNRSAYENYIPRLIDSLRRYGHVKTPDIIIESLDRNTNQAVVKLGGNSKFKIITDYTGEMISIEGIK